jgi:hypothetical protein
MIRLFRKMGARYDLARVLEAREHLESTARRGEGSTGRGRLSEPIHGPDCGTIGRWPDRTQGDKK